ncbi:hypothetical protein L211DRAFT_661383 [Terfezia boudieri ATCC MYA-4762]|uniref:Uncharacterized protein n=1 Tax=Terfezia boudieri ATCC MYA-4762 TaxID=1051890 RepID=A0A3N4M1T5_9PEZI|nr:hypothetical protein L211DRAFT_661383 [Terfezia boudieri ATCC MYA-4762]
MSIVTLEDPNTDLELNMSMSDLLGDPGEWRLVWSDSSFEFQESENMAKSPTVNSTEGGPAAHTGKYDGLPLADITASSIPYTSEYYQSTGAIAVSTSEARGEPLTSKQHPETQSPNHKKSRQTLGSADHLLPPPQSTSRAPSKVLGKRKDRELPKTTKQKKFRGAVRGRDYPLHESDYAYVDAPSQNMDNGYWKRMALRYEENVFKALKKWQEEGNTLPPGASLQARAEVPDPSHKEASLDFWYGEYIRVIRVLQQLKVDVELEKRRKRSPTPTFSPQQNLLQTPSCQSQCLQDMPQGLGQHFMGPTHYNAQGTWLYPASFQDGTGYPLCDQEIKTPVSSNYFSQPVMGQYRQQQ